mmetsp:Transcript_38929/g.59163  ORF Transcript_38929/g.59163 Transcript_38929/m.59163 type:complete len:83 (+) Transcript_38929:96-344(+)|eukprot:CAMPEP_0170492740 /NCGR_PEP_ID=MMETSP0208-20121228/12759_1 /TAXON_ID=197538 /ORGANISM="Strombidium inclinatum, Strain S3" /LENGTH=82 /DNA_ID=CAMNT_0010768531 /DNA_START=68 /DNA_END=316 /DNA_ORIENTATION=-
MIKFIGKRHPKNVTLNINDSLPAAGGAAPLVDMATDAKPLNPGVTVEYATEHIGGRGLISEEEMEIINAGTNECDDWSQITV